MSFHSSVKTHSFHKLTNQASILSRIFLPSTRKLHIGGPARNTKINFSEKLIKKFSNYLPYNYAFYRRVFSSTPSDDNDKKFHSEISAEDLESELKELEKDFAIDPQNQSLSSSSSSSNIEEIENVDVGLDNIDHELDAEATPLNEGEAEVHATMNETIGSDLEEHMFQAETKQLLDIVSHSLYTDKEVFVRELLSNASDALEKVRYLINKDASKVIQSDLPLEINIFTDSENNRLIIQDTGIGMNEKELIENLGTIARSGSKAFVQKMAEEKATATDAASQIIGQFGVGFYSVFMVCDKVDVYSRAANEDQGFFWTSDGSGNYKIAKAANVERGTKLVIHLKPELRDQFADRGKIEETIKKYSSYLAFPIKLNGHLVTATGAIWNKKPNEVTEEQHQEFYKVIANRYDEPFYTYHSHLDTTKFQAQVLLYFPKQHQERMMGRLKPGVSIYCRKVLVKKNAPEILPDWLRFIKGVVDSENIPIHISRENMQDSMLIRSLNEMIMLKVVDFLNRQSTKDPVKFKEWYEEHESFIKEGVCSDEKNRVKIAKLLRYETNKTNPGELITFDEYKTRMKSEQNDIYYTIAQNRQSALASPYLEAFEEADLEVLLCYENLDDFCMRNLISFDSKQIKSIETDEAATEVAKLLKKPSNESEKPLDKIECDHLSSWLKNHYPKQISNVESTTRLKSHPCVVVDPTPIVIKRMMEKMGTSMGETPQKIQINPTHKVIKGLAAVLQKGDDACARVIAKQMINNAFVAAGIIEDAKIILKDVNELMTLALGNYTSEATPTTSTNQTENEATATTTASIESETKSDQK